MSRSALQPWGKLAPFNHIHITGFSSDAGCLMVELCIKPASRPEMVQSPSVWSRDSHSSFTAWVIVLLCDACHSSLCFHKCSMENHHNAMSRACWSLQPHVPQGTLCSADFHGVRTLLVLVHLCAHGSIGKLSFHIPSSGFFQEKFRTKPWCLSGDTGDTPTVWTGYPLQRTQDSKISWRN